LLYGKKSKKVLSYSKLAVTGDATLSGQGNNLFKPISGEAERWAPPYLHCQFDSAIG